MAAERAHREELAEGLRNMSEGEKKQQEALMQRQRELEEALAKQVLPFLASLASPPLRLYHISPT
jgi:hypothetical protein